MEVSTDIPTAPLGAGAPPRTSPVPTDRTATPATLGEGLGSAGRGRFASSLPSSRRRVQVNIFTESENETPAVQPALSRLSSLVSVPSATTSAVRGATKAAGKRGGVEKGQSKGTTSPPRAKRLATRSPSTARSPGSGTTSPTPKPTRGAAHPASSRLLSGSATQGGKSTTSTGANKSKRSSPRPEGKRSPPSKAGRKDATPIRGPRGPTPLRRRSPDGGKKKGRKIFQGLMNAEEKARIVIEKEYEAEWKTLLSEIAIDAFEPHRHNLLQLQEDLYKVRRECDAITTRAENALEKLVKSTAEFLQSVHLTGADVLRENRILELDIPLTTPTFTTEVDVLSCARDPASHLTEPHLPVKRRDTDQEPEIRRIRSFFFELTQELDGVGPFSEKNLHATVEKADEVEKNTQILTYAFSSLIQRVHRTIQQWKKKMESMQAVLNEQRSRVKVADDYLRETTAKRRVEVDSAIQLCRQFGMELRQRMDALEKEVRDSLSELIQRSTEVSIENNAFSDHAQLLLNKENTIQLYMSKMERTSVEQGKLLRDVRLRLLQLWKERCGEGDEERATLTHSGLPKKYHAALNACDRDTLLRLLHFVALNSSDVPGLLISALDEHEVFITDNSEEAQAVAKQSATETAVRALLEKLYEEGDIKLNPRHSSTSLLDAVEDMVRQYNTYMTKLEKQQRRVERKKLMETASSHAFFDGRTPVPDEYAAELASRPLVPRKRPVICDGNASRMQVDNTSHTSPVEGPTASVRNPNTKEATTAMVLPQIEVCHVLSYLRQSHPSALDPPGTATVVGFGRWEGKAAQRGIERDACSIVRGVGEGTTALPAGDAADMAHLHAGSKPSPPPPVPPRISLMQHMLEHHSNDVQTISVVPDSRCRCFPGEDAPFLKLQRDLFETDS
ncbi:uncharacterized protein Tco025E_00708 [Trypanosoma conorhini]|uniref:Uncharacterized protein n=1 Tax=Trypanosoma conorhini TaxID=83891 RepID=A0A422QAP1_9TRYP|nr:uncharacterized protein Tco025E_00708 [Trypanosoma conorhini]RNF27024.1 hypothetical protein Tco025E_00708 [Trypanosoma conorhini]